jgi:sugar-specific transcriptional regulator TrmB
VRELATEATPQKEQILFNQILREAMSISESAAEALRVLLTVGPLTLGEISNFSGLGYTVGSKALIELQNEHLVRKIPGAVFRFAPVPPYGGFEAFLKDFQKIVKGIGDNAGNAIDSALTAIGRNTGESKKEAQETGRSTLDQIVSESESLKDAFSKNVSEMLAKLKQDTETTKGMVTDALKKHVDEHKTKTTDVREELISGIDHADEKFETTGKKYLKEINDTISTSLGKYKAYVQSFIDGLRAELQKYSIEVKDSLSSLEGELTEIQSKLAEKSRTTIAVVKTKVSETLDSQRKTFGQKSLDLQSAVREAMDDLTKSVSNQLTRLKSYIDDMTEKLSTETSASFSGFEEKTSTTFADHGSRFKSDITDCAQFINKTVDTVGDSVSQQAENINIYVRELIENFESTANSSLESLKAKVGQMYSVEMANLMEAMSSTKKDLNGVVSNSLSSCKTIASSLDAATSTLIPGYSATLERAASEFEKGLPKTLSRISKRIDSTASGVSEKAITTVISSLTALEPDVNKVLERALAQVSKGSGVEKSFTTEVKGLVDDALERHKKNLTNELKETLKEQAKIEKASSEDEIEKIGDDIGKILSTAVKNAEQELGKSNVATASTVPRLSEHCSSIELLVRKIENAIDASVKQYVGEGDTTNKTFGELLLKQRESLEGSLREVSQKMNEQQTSRAKEVSDLVNQAHSNLNSIMTNHLDDMDQCVQRAKSDLSELAIQSSKSIETTRSATQANINNQINATLRTNREAIESMTNNLRSILSNVAKGLDDSTASLQKELDSINIQSVDEIKSATGEYSRKISESREVSSNRIDQIAGEEGKELDESSTKHTSETLNTISTITNALSRITNTSLESFKSEALGARERFQGIISTHLQGYEQEAFGAGGTCGYLLTRSYEKHREVSIVNERKMSETLLTNQTRCENAINKTNTSLTGVVERNEALIKDETKNALGSFREGIDKLRKASAGAERVLHGAWMELEKTPQFAAEKTWPAVTKTAIMAVMQEMVKRTRSHIEIILPSIQEAPLEDVKNVKKATRVTLVLSDMRGDQRETELLAEMTRQANITLRVGPNLSCFGCSRDNEEMLFAPVAEKDNELVGVVSSMENYIQFFDRIILPAMLGSSHDIKESSVQPQEPKNI